MKESEIGDDRKTAVLLGLRYYRGSQCLYLHEGLRFTSNSACVACVAEQGRRYKAEHRTSEAERKREWRLANPDRFKEQKRLAYARNPQRLVELEARIERALDKARIAAERDSYWQKKRDEVAFNNLLMIELDRDHEERQRLERQRATWRRARSTRRALARNAEGRYSVADEIELSKEKTAGCVYCGDRSRLHLDHKTPLSRGGTNYRSNLQWLCQPHNQSKYNRTDEEYRALIGLPPAAPSFDDLF